MATKCNVGTWYQLTLTASGVWKANDNTWQNSSMFWFCSLIIRRTKHASAYFKDSKDFGGCLMYVPWLQKYCSSSLRKGTCPHFDTHLFWKGWLGILPPYLYLFIFRGSSGPPLFNWFLKMREKRNWAKPLTLFPLDLGRKAQMLFLVRCSGGPCSDWHSLSNSLGLKQVTSWSQVATLPVMGGSG